uniref:DUF7869 domain-containing protein n=1 Tax=Panagrolaimus superbus TaxID=310955 RepID=A0A914Z478_9BILA
MSEVGHTHNEVDQQFGVLANALSHNKIYSPQGLAKLTEKTLSGVVATSMAPATYDFKSILKEIENPSGKIKSNHFFEISKDEDGNVILKIARFMRSRTFLANDPRAADPCLFKMFKVGRRNIIKLKLLNF